MVVDYFTTNAVPQINLLRKKVDMDWLSGPETHSSRNQDENNEDATAIMISDAEAALSQLDLKSLLTTAPPSKKSKRKKQAVVPTRKLPQDPDAAEREEAYEEPPSNSVKAKIISPRFSMIENRYGVLKPRNAKYSKSSIDRLANPIQGRTTAAARRSHRHQPSNHQTKLKSTQRRDPLLLAKKSSSAARQQRQQRVRAKTTSVPTSSRKTTSRRTSSAPKPPVVRPSKTLIDLSRGKSVKKKTSEKKPVKKQRQESTFLTQISSTDDNDDTPESALDFMTDSRYETQKKPRRSARSNVRRTPLIKDCLTKSVLSKKTSSHQRRRKKPLDPREKRVKKPASEKTSSLPRINEKKPRRKQKQRERKSTTTTTGRNLWGVL